MLSVEQVFFSCDTITSFNIHEMFFLYNMEMENIFFAKLFSEPQIITVKLNFKIVLLLTLSLFPPNIKH